LGKSKISSHQYSIGGSLGESQAAFSRESSRVARRKCIKKAENIFTPVIVSIARQRQRLAWPGHHSGLALSFSSRYEITASTAELMRGGEGRWASAVDHTSPFFPPSLFKSRRG